jgi:hypothetical protein
MSSSSEFSSSATSSSSASPADCEFGIKLLMEMSEYTFPEEDRPIRRQSWRMRITVVEVNNIDPNIFVYNLGVSDAESGEKRKLFQNIASPVDLIEYAAGAPVDNTSPQFFRLSSVDMIHRNANVLQQTWDDIKVDVEDLIQNSAFLCEVEPGEEFTAGVLPYDPPVPPVPPYPSSESSEAPEPCPVDPVATIEITSSNDPDFPTGTLLNPTAGPTPSPDCERTWEATSGSKVITLVTSLTLNQVLLTIKEGAVVLATSEDGLSAEYGAIICYAYNPAQEHTIEITSA